MLPFFFVALKYFFFLFCTQLFPVIAVSIVLLGIHLFSSRPAQDYRNIIVMFRSYQVRIRLLLSFRIVKIKIDTFLRFSLYVFL